MPKGFLFDLNKCTGCQACEIACTIENALEPGRSWRQVNTFNEYRYPEAPLFHLSMACNHCADAPCMKSCPALAYQRDETTGAVTIDAQACIGCRYCSWACPYDAPRYDVDTGIMTKCTFCNHRLEQELEPACVALCPTNALQYGELHTDGWVEKVPGFLEAELQPAIRFTPLNGKHSRPEFAMEPNPATVLRRSLPSRITLRAEWPLVLFTLFAACLVSVWTASLADVARLQTIPFFGAAVFGMWLGTIHLGRKRRAWRAVLNLRSSWLSREVVLYTLFLLLSAALLLFLPANLVLRGFTSLVGFAALFAMDRVYDVAKKKTGDRIHSADVLLSGIFVTSLLWVHVGAAAVFAALKVTLYVRRKLRMAQQQDDSRPVWSVLRLACGVLLPAILTLLTPPHWRELVLVSVAVGESIDRCEYYAELETRTPQRQMESDLQALLATSVIPICRTQLLCLPVGAAGTPSLPTDRSDPCTSCAVPRPPRGSDP